MKKEIIFNKIYRKSLNEGKVDRLKGSKIPNLSPKTRQELIDIYSKNPNFKDNLDWNKSADFDDSTFEDLISIEKLREIEKKDPHSFFKEAPDENIFFTPLDNLENNDYLFVVPLSYEAANVMDSYNCGGVGAKWCIGQDDTDEYWDIYTKGNESKFILAFNKHYKDLSTTEPTFYINKVTNKPYTKREVETKYMIELRKDGRIYIWNQGDFRRAFRDGDFGITKEDIVNSLEDIELN